MTEDLNLGRLLGRREAFTMVAARCSAAEAQLLRQMRDEKLYLKHAEDWGDFCAKFLHINYQAANRIIQNLNEFGPGYFHLAQLTHISPATYRAIAPSIEDRVLHHQGESIAIVPDNAAKVAAAVAELRKAAAPPAPQPAVDPVTCLEKTCTELVMKIEGVAAQRRQRDEVRAAICYLRIRLNQIEMTL